MMKLLKTKSPIKRWASFGKLFTEKWFLLISVSLLIAFGIIAYYSLFIRGRGLSYVYEISPLSGQNNRLHVNLNMQKVRKNEHLKLYKGDIPCSDIKCRSAETGEKMDFDVKDDFIEIITGNDKSILVEYNVSLGQLDKHGHRGGAYSDMVTFDGDGVLILPQYAFSTEESEIKRNVGRITIHYDIPKDWVSVVPYSKQTGDELFSQLVKPTWADIYDLRKSCFAFGKFRKYSYEQGEGKLQVLIDPAYKGNYSQEVEDGLNSIYKYYAGLFESEINFSILLLREDLKDGSYIISGSSTQTCGSSFQPGKARDWQLMGHRMFHAFFDTAVRETTFHTPPQLWFYEGMATYYENMSMNSLPAGIRQKTGLDKNEEFLMLYKQYLYMRLKDKYFFSVVPMEEEKYSSFKGITEFLHYTEAPLMIKALDDMGYSKYGEHDRILKYILKHGKKGNLLLEELVKYAAGDGYKTFESKFMYNNELLPLWYLGDGKKEDTRRTIQSLKEIEYTQWTWFRLLDPEYPLDSPETEGLSELTGQAEKTSVHFASEDVEKNVKKLSPAVYSLLKQYYLRADVCGADTNNKMLRYELLGKKENLDKWALYKKGLKKD